MIWRGEEKRRHFELFLYNYLIYQGTYHFNFQRCAPHRAKFLVETIADLRSNLQERGSNLVVRCESLLPAIKDLVHICQNSEAPVSSIVYQKEVTTEETNLEKKIQAFCKDSNIEDVPVWGLTLFHK